MAELTLGGVSYDVPPLSLGKLIKAAPYIDAINESFLAQKTGLTDSLELSANVLKLAEIGLKGHEKAPTSDELLEAATITDAAKIRDFFFDLLRESGFTTGEEPAPETLDPAQNP